MNGKTELSWVNLDRSKTKIGPPDHQKPGVHQKSKLGL